MLGSVLPQNRSDYILIKSMPLLSTGCFPLPYKVSLNRDMILNPLNVNFQCHDHIHLYCITVESQNISKVK